MAHETDDLDERLLIEALARVLGDRYGFVARLGGGAFGEVYRVHDSMLDRDVAVKRVRLDAFAEPAQRSELRERTIREAKVAAKLKHPNIVTIYDVVDRPDMSFIIMEFIEGITLARILKDEGRLSVDETLRILDPTASALDFAHKKGVVHRDIKPANIMVETSNRDVKVTDFGIAKSDTFTELTAAGSVLGTPNYMSPEQARGESSIDYRADLFSLGCVLYECLIGKRAFAGKNVMTTLMSIMNEGPRQFDPEALGLHPGVGDVLKRGLAKDPDERYSTAGELVEALRSLPRIERDTVAVESPPAAAPVVTRREPGNTSSFDARLSGSLGDTTVAELIREVYSSRNTGILHFERDGVAKRIYFKKGSIVFANSDVNDDRLGEFLIRIGQIDRDTFDRVSGAMQKTGHRFGATLVELGVIERAKMGELVRRQVQEIIYSVFEWSQGNYAFEFLDRPVEEDIIVELSTAELILIGVRRIGSLDRVRSALGALDSVLRHTENPLLLYQKMTLTTSEGYVLSRVDDATSISEIAAISPLGEDETLRCVYALVAAGVVELASKGAPPSASRFRVSKTSEERFPAPDLQSEERPEAPAPPAPASGEPGEQEKAILADVAEKHGSLDTADYYELLGVSAGASDDEIKRGYYAMARKYHPDRHHLPHMRDVQGNLEEIFAKVTAAYEELSDPGSRRRYDGARHQKARATAETSRETAAPGPAPYTVPPEVIAERHYQQGYAHFERTEYFDAIQCLRESVRLMSGEPRYHKLLARALSKNPKWRKEAEQHFLAALKADEFDIECLVGLAENYENENLKIRATKIYERILAYDPDNEIAREKLKPPGKKSRR
jgi:serine/threonine protein kinase/curved DNA-binding protein CbpA